MKFLAVVTPPYIYHFATWHNLIVDLMKHLTPYMAAVKGHVNQTNNGIKLKITPEPPPSEDAPIEKLDTGSNQVFTNIIDPQQSILTNITGRFSDTYNMEKMCVCHI